MGWGAEGRGGDEPGEISKGRGTIQRKTPPGEAPTPPSPPPARRALRGGAGRGPGPGGGGCRSPPRPRRGGGLAPAQPLAHTHACACVCVCVCGSLHACPCLRSAREAPAAAVAERGCFPGRGGECGGVKDGGGVGEMFGAFLGARLTAGVFPPPWSCPAEEEEEGGDGERAGAGRGWGQTDGAPGSAPPGGGHRGRREPAAGRGAEGPAEPG